MFNGSLRVCRILRFVKKIRFCLLESGRTKAWCPGLVSRPSAKAQEPMARSRGLDIQPPKLFGVSAECQSIETIGKKQRAVERSRGLVIQPQKLSVGAYFELSFLHKSVYEITDCAKNQIFPSRVWADQEVEGLLFSPKNSQLVHIFSFCSQGVVS